MTPRAAQVLGALLAFSGCARLPGGPVVPAVLTGATPADRGELAHVLGEALHRPPVLLADDALLHDDVLILERQPRRDASGVRLNGRERDRPERFELVKEGTRCFLIHANSGRRWSLAQGCTARPSAP